MKLEELEIRKATESDIPALVELANQAYAVENFLEGTRTDESRMRAELNKGRILVAEEQVSGKIAACVYVEVRGAGAGYLGLLAVSPRLQGTGLARRMMVEAEEFLRLHDCTRVEISVLSLRPELLPLYKHFGFVETGSEPFGFHRALKPGVECYTILMAKPLY
jgi:ribosomal protein S18 acetylase RimI-like enzyme